MPTKILAHNLDLAGIKHALAGIYPDPPAVIVVTDQRLHELLKNAMPHLNDFEIDAMKKDAVKLFGVPLEVIQ